VEPGTPAVPNEPVALRPLRVGEILDVAIKVYRANFKTLIKAVLVIIAPVQVLNALLNSSVRSVTNRANSFTVNGNTAGFHGSDIATVILAGLAIALLGFVAGQLASAASFRAVSEAYLGEEADWRRSLRFALSRLRSLLWLAFLHAIVLAVGFVLCVVPGIYLYGALAVATPALLFEDARGTKALRRSRELVRTRWWSTAGALLAASILTAIVQGAVSGVLVGAVVGSHGNQLVADILGVIAGTASSMVTTPFLAAVIVVLYFDLRVRKEGFDLFLLAQRMGVDAPVGAAPVSFIPEPPPVVVEGDEPPFWPPPPGWKPRSGT
jgi:hypothetical protein